LKLVEIFQISFAEERERKALFMSIPTAKVKLFHLSTVKIHKIPPFDFLMSSFPHSSTFSLNPVISLPFFPIFAIC